MKDNTPFIAVILLFVMFIAISYNAERTRRDMENFKEDVRQMMNKMDDSGDLKDYMDDSTVQQIYNYTHNLNKN